MLFQISLTRVVEADFCGDISSRSNAKFGRGGRGGRSKRAGMDAGLDSEEESLQGLNDDQRRVIQARTSGLGCLQPTTSVATRTK